MASKRQDLLKKVAMPKKAAPAMEADHDLEMLGGGEEDAAHEDAESPEFEAGEEEGAMEPAEGGESAHAEEIMKDLTDEDIIAEAKRRGLLEDGEEAPEMGDMGEEPAQPM